MTRDGFEISPTISIKFSIKRPVEKKPSESGVTSQYGYDEEAVRNAITREVIQLGTTDNTKVRMEWNKLAMPGRIINALKKVKAKNPVMLLDEIDKLGQWWNGSPESALLEVLDPEQNHTFTDHYMELPFDLSEVLFICTANSLENISGPLRDRLELVEVSGYTHEEKLHIAKDHLVPRQLKDHGVHEGALVVSDEALTRVIREYTREAGVRQLNREIVRMCRGLALKIAKNPDTAQTTLLITPERLKELLGKPKFRDEVAERTGQPGVATGLAWTPVGGDILFIETSHNGTAVGMSLTSVRTSEAQDLKVLLSFSSPEQVFDLRDPSPFREKDLADDFARYLLVVMEEEPESKNVQLKIQIPIGSLSHFSQNDIEQAIRDYYSFEIQSLTGEIRSILSEGRWGLLLGISFLFACQFGAYLLADHEGFLAEAIKQGIEILGWVALWNPINHLLYEWWPVLQKRQLVEKLSRITVCVEALPTQS